MKAIILAGGYSKRLWPLTTELPKAFLEFDGRPVIDHIMEKLDGVDDVDEVIVSTNKKYEYFFVYWQSKSEYKTPIKLIIEETTGEATKLGAIGAIHYVLEHENIGGEFLLVAGDNLFEFDLGEFVADFKKAGKTALAVKDLKSHSRIKKLGVVSLDERHRVTEFIEKPVSAISTIVCSGVYAFSKSTRSAVQQYLDEGHSPDSTGFLLEWMLNKGHEILGWEFAEPWFDIGSHPSFDEAKKYYRDIKGTVLITGGVGYVGHHVAELLLDDGFNVKVLDLLLYDFEPDDRYDFVLGDVTNQNDVRKAMEGIDYVVHLAALSNDPSVDLSPDKGIEINYNSTKLVAGIAKEYGVKRFIFPSSCSVYGDLSEERIKEDAHTKPLTLYAHTKLASENYLRGLVDDRFDVCILRYGTLFGHSKNMRFDLVANVIPVEAVADGEIQLFGGSQRRPLLHVRDAARAMVVALKENAMFGGEVFNIGDDNQNYTISDLTYEIQKHIFPDTPVKEIPGKADHRSYSVSFSKAKENLGFSAEIGVLPGVQEMARMLRAHDYGDPRDDKYFRVKHLKNQGMGRSSAS